MRAVRAEASAPGKLILMGEHAAVYGVPAVVAAVGLRTVARISPRQEGHEVELDLADFELRLVSSWEEVLEYGRGRREHWDAYRSGPSPQGFSALRAGDEAGVVKTVIAETVSFLERETGVAQRPPLRLSVSSELPIGSGLGSSASVAVAVTAALMASIDGSNCLDPQAVAKVALEAEKRQHGQPSGIDHMTVIRGGLLLLSREGRELRVEELSQPSWFQRGLRVFDSGAPVETTGEVVAGVRAFADRDPDAFAATLTRMDGAVRAFAEALGQGRPAWSEVLTAVKTFERGLETLGVVPAAVVRAVRRIEAAGGAAKISGAGALSGDGGGSLVVFWPPAGAGEPSAILSEYRRFSAELGADGLACRSHGEEAHAGA